MGVFGCFVGFLLLTGTIVDSQTCDDSQRDVVILLDSSGSVGSRNFHKSKLFIADLIGDFDIGKEKVQLGMVLFHTRASRVMWLNDFSVKEKMKNKVMRIRYRRGSTATGEALRITNENILSSEHGDRPDVPDLVIVITDGMSNNQTETKIEAKRLHSRGVDVVSIGVGDGCDKNELESIASHSKFAFLVDTFDGLGDLQSLLSQAACEGLKPTTIAQTKLPSLKTTTEIMTTTTQETTTNSPEISSSLTTVSWTRKKATTSTLALPVATNPSSITDRLSLVSTTEEEETTTDELISARMLNSGSVYKLFSETTPESKSTSVYESFKLQTKLTSTAPTTTIDVTSPAFTSTTLLVPSTSTITEPENPTTSHVSSTYEATSSTISTSTEVEIGAKSEPSTSSRISTLESQPPSTALHNTTTMTFSSTDRIYETTLRPHEKITESNITAENRTGVFEQNNEADEKSGTMNQKLSDLVKDWGLVAGITTGAAVIAAVSFGTLIWFMKRRRGNMDVTKDNQL